MATLEDLESIDIEIRKYKELTEEEISDLKLIWGNDASEDKLLSMSGTDRVSELFGCKISNNCCIGNKCPIFKFIKDCENNIPCSVFLDKYILESR